MTSPSTQPTDSENAAADSWVTDSGTIRRGMKVIGPDGTVLGTVSGVEGEEVLLAEHAAANGTRSSPSPRSTA